jgi:hypothetical protein
MKAPNSIYPAALGSVLIPSKRDYYEATGEFRSPRKGEYYLSGAIVEAYRAPNDLNTPFWIAKFVGKGGRNS